METKICPTVKQVFSSVGGKLSIKATRRYIETVLKKGKPVVIAIRDTEIDRSNPYSTHERWLMIHRAFKKYGELVRIIVIPDIDEIRYGREVGYNIRKIEMGPHVEAISGTKERLKHPPNFPIYWLTGQSGAGKTSLASVLGNM